MTLNLSNKYTLPALALGVMILIALGWMLKSEHENNQSLKAQINKLAKSEAIEKKQVEDYMILAAQHDKNMKYALTVAGKLQSQIDSLNKIKYVPPVHITFHNDAQRDSVLSGLYPDK